VKCTSKKTESSTAEQERISAAVVEFLRRQVADRGLVVWYDPQKAYEHLAARSAIADGTVLRHEDGFFQLRDQLEPFLECVNEPGAIAGEAGSVAAGVLQIVFGQVSAEEMLLQFTAQESNDAAPLHEVLPSWQDTRTAWKELDEGKYDWAHQAMAYWPDRVKSACLINKSFAIAHGLAVPEDDAAADTPRRRGRKKKE
jgi:hypothetical protein